MKNLRKLSLLGVMAVSSLFITTFTGMTAYAAAPGAVGSWTGSSNILPAPEENSASVTYDGYDYVVGGVPAVGYSNAVYSAPINSDGSVGGWTTQTHSLPVQVDSPAAVTYDGYIYVTGGLLGAGYNSNVYVAQLSNGTVGAWATSAHTLPIAVYYSTADVYDGYVYVLGGQYSGGITAHIFTASLSSGGGIGAWTTSSISLPQNLENTSSVINNGYIYVLGGDSGSSPLNTIYYSSLGANGAIGSWTTSSVTLPDHLSETVAETYNGYVYVFGGQNNSSNTSAVYSALFNNNGTLGSWSTSISSLPQPLNSATGVTSNGYVYIVGGYGPGLLNNVYYAQLTGESAPGISNTTSAVTVDGSVTVNVLSGITGDPDPSSLSIISGPSHGTAYDPPGTITYTPDADYMGSDSLVYQVCSLNDENLCSQATLSFTVTETAPDTGYGAPSTTNTWETMGIFVASSVSLLSGGYLSRKVLHKKTK